MPNSMQNRQASHVERQCPCKRTSTPGCFCSFDKTEILFLETTECHVLLKLCIQNQLQHWEGSESDRQVSENLFTAQLRAFLFNWISKRSPRLPCHQLMMWAAMVVHSLSGHYKCFLFTHMRAIRHLHWISCLYTNSVELSTWYLSSRSPCSLFLLVHDSIKMACQVAAANPANLVIFHI